MRRTKVIVDIGTSSISVFCKSLLLKEPNIALIRRKNGTELVAFGNHAINMVGSADEHCYFVNPVSDGVIVNAEVAGLIIAHCLKKALPAQSKALEVYAVIPCGLSVAERENAELAFTKAGCKDVILVESVLGLLPFVSEKGSAVVLLGGGTTEFAVLSDKGIISACSINIGGKEIDKRIKDKVLDIYNIIISEFTAEKVKKEIGSLYDNDTSYCPVIGRGVLDRAVKRDDVTAESIKSAIAYCYKKIVEVAESLFTTLPANMVSDVISKGLYFAGGGALMPGLQDFVHKYLNIAATVDPDPETAALRGISILIEQNRLQQYLNNFS